MPETDSLSLFDADTYQKINEARWRLAADVIGELRTSGLHLATAFDFGAGPGWFAHRLTASGLDVVALEGRADVAAEGQARAPAARFEVFDFDEAGWQSLPLPRDFCLAFGILYHLENPLRALRVMGALTSQVLLLETMTVPLDFPGGRVVRENANATQGIRSLAFILSPDGVERGLWAAGYNHIYRCQRSIDHDDFRDLTQTHRRRHVWLATRQPINLPGFEPISLEEPQRANYWSR